MDEKRKESRYRRIHQLLSELLTKSDNTTARMATVVAMLHHKIDYFFWTGFYLLTDGDLTVNVYQGPLACQQLKKDTGVCWAAINIEKTLIVPDVKLFTGHIACDSRSNSEIAVPFCNSDGEIIGVFDVDSREKGSFTDTDTLWLEKILKLIWI